MHRDKTMRPNSKRNETLRQSDAESSREKLIVSAERLFADRGFDGVSVRDIANAAGVFGGGR